MKEMHGLFNVINYLTRINRCTFWTAIFDNIPWNQVTYASNLCLLRKAADVRILFQTKISKTQAKPFG